MTAREHAETAQRVLHKWGSDRTYTVVSHALVAIALAMTEKQVVIPPPEETEDG